METFLTRAGNAPLNLHINSTTRDGVGRPYGDQVNATLKNSIAPIFPQIKEPRFNINMGWSRSKPDSKFCRSLLSQFFNKDTSLAKLIALDTTVDSGPRVFYIQTTEDPQNKNAVLLDMRTRQLDDLLLPVNTLVLSNIAPPWTSSAFHGLVDLRLHALDSLKIRESQLLAVLVHSPQLRVLEFGIEIEPAAAPLAPVTILT